jgi:hypothetical protein
MENVVFCLSTYLTSIATKWTSIKIDRLLDLSYMGAGLAQAV